ncbi:MAG: serine/threonine protein kinase [Actinobacteria bacterium]|nr:serine/threonine protein kinase [Actinomycetota bacterium]
MTMSVADLAGRVLASRYRLLASIGAGGGGRVYIADDVRLRRRVAVKVLHPALADDAGFLRRFRTEAQLAASLHHPHVMAVYDWGEDGVPFMVLELLAGGSLRSMLDRGVRLTPSQGAHIGRQVTSALDYAHSRGLVHRDIKPANLLFDEHGIGRVADFGLARALAEASWTEPAGAVVGTARYAAPEQATGVPLDGRADLYALALVLVESVTGRVPFAADTPLGTLAARTQEPIVAPDELGALGRVVERAGRPDPSERYPDARAMGEAIADSAGRLPRPGPLTLAGLGRTVDDPNPTEFRRTGGVFDQDADETVETPAPNGATLPIAPELIADRPPGSRRAVPIVVGGIVALVLAIATALLLARPGAATTAAPSLVGLTQESAANRASESGVRMEVEQRVSDDPAGFVIEQSPGPGEWVRDGGTVTVVVSRGPPPVAVPDVTGQAEAAAQLLLTEQGFVVEVVPEHNEDVAASTALRTEPAANEKLRPDSPIKLIVSAGPAPVSVPDVSGRTYEEAAAALAEARLGASMAEEFSDSVEAGTVIRTEPAAGLAAPRDSAVAVVVSKGPELVDVPSLRGMTVEEASAALRAIGLVPDVEDYDPGGRVRAQDPDPGTQVKKGEKVTLFL